jgi:hypothetical protein
MRSTRIASLVGATVALSAAAAAPAAALAPTGLYARFTGCPVNNPAFLTAFHDPNGSGGACVWDQSSGGANGGEAIIGKTGTAVPIVNPMTLQAGVTIDANSNETFWNASPASQTLVDPGQPVPGGLSALLGVPGGDNGNGRSVTAKTILAPGAPQINLNNLISQSGPGIVLPIKIQLINPKLGGQCFIGTDANPIMVSLTDGTTSPPPPNTPISGNIANLDVVDNGNLVTIGVLDLVDNAFAVPAANGCGHPAGRLDGAINARQGLPSPAGNNTLILNGSSALALPDSVIASEK